MYLPPCHKKTGTVLMCASDRMKQSKNAYLGYKIDAFRHKNTQFPTNKQTDYSNNLSRSKKWVKEQRSVSGLFK